MIGPRVEEFADVGREISLCFERIGDPSGKPLLLVAGLGQQLISWPTPVCEALAARGFYVVRFDNRDSGRSTHLTAPAPGPLAMLTGRYPSDTYGLHDMARDTIGVLDALHIEQSHVVGASMGGMIAQVLASRWPTRVASLTSVFSTTGEPRIGRPAWTTWAKMVSRPPTTALEAADADVAMYDHIGSHGFVQDREWIREQAKVAWERNPRTDGTARQLAAILATGDRTAEVRQITAPTLVVHGDRDRMVATSGGRATHRAIPHSQLRIIPGMGHDYPPDLWTELVNTIAEHAQIADPAPEPANNGDAAILPTEQQRNEHASAT